MNITVAKILFELKINSIVSISSLNTVMRKFTAILPKQLRGKTINIQVEIKI